MEGPISIAEQIHAGRSKFWKLHTFSHNFFETSFKQGLYFIMADIEKNEPAPAKEEEKKVFSEADIPEDATWGEVFQACCCHSLSEWAMIFGGVCVVLFFLYFFLFGLDLLGSGAKVMGGCTAGSLFGDDTNPVAGLMVGILATVFLQSSSTTTSIVVSLVGANSVSVNQGIYMIMGANIGTSGKFCE